MDIRKVKKLIELIENSCVSEIEIHEGEESVRLRRGHVDIPKPHLATPEMMPITHPTESISSHLNTGAPSSPDNYADEGHVINSPMVGIFYNAPSPDASPFVKVGQAINENDPLCIVEAMKIMNHIESDISGKVLRVLVENGEAVEYGQPLFIINNNLE